MFFHWFLALPDYKTYSQYTKKKINLQRLQTQISCLLLLQEVKSQAINHSFFHQFNVIYKPLCSWKPGYAQVENLKFLVWKTTSKPASQQVVTQENEQS